MTKALDKQQLSKLLLVALSSDQPGEVMAAINRIKALLKKAGLDQYWLAGAITTASSLPGNIWEPVPSTYTSWQDQLNFCMTNVKAKEAMRFREAEFVESLAMQKHMKGNDWEPSPRQGRWLQEIFNKLSLTRT